MNTLRVFLALVHLWAVKSQTVTFYIYDTDDGFVITQRGSFTNLSAFGPTPANVIFQSTNFIASGFDEVDAFDVVGDELEAVRRSWTDVIQNDIPIGGGLTTRGNVTGNHFVGIGLRNSSQTFTVDSNYTEGREMNADMLFAGHTLAGRGYPEDASGAFVVDGGSAGPQSYVVIFGQEPPSDNDDDECPCRRFQLICRIRNRCLFGFN